jgi:ketosteroid isomerase-like protein
VEFSKYSVMTKISRILFLFSVLLMGSCTEPSVEKSSNYQSDFAETLEELEEATARFVAGDADAFISMWEQSENITLSGGFGGEIEKGWEAISQRLNQVSNLYELGRFEAERVSYTAGNEIAYVTQHEMITHRIEDGSDAVRNYRVTMVFRYAGNEWKLIHRQADLHTEPDKILGMR